MYAIRDCARSFSFIVGPTPQFHQPAAGAGINGRTDHHDGARSFFRERVVGSTGVLPAAVNRLRGKLSEVAARPQQTGTAKGKMTVFDRLL
jgi:hypothetical protein